MENEINKWSSYLVTNKLADIIIVAAHSGFGSDDGITSPNFMLESQAKTGTKNAHNIDLMICGHDHSATIQTVKNADGKDIYIVDGGGTTVTENVFTVTFNADKSVKDFTVTAKSVALATAKGDEALGSTEQHWFDETYAWASTPLGTFNNGWNDVTAEATGKTNNDMVLQQTSLMNFVHKAQIWSTWQSYEKQGHCRCHRLHCLPGLRQGLRRHALLRPEGRRHRLHAGAVQALPLLQQPHVRCGYDRPAALQLDEQGRRHVHH
jgi:2',3'-cyclic-nucleotide 2'-phosphodiesterase (5'-nucleotidase family)